MEFWVKLIVVKKEQSINAAKSLKDCCTYIDNLVWIFEGEIQCLKDDGVIFNVIGEGAVPCLGDLDHGELVELCVDVFGINVFDLAYDPLS